MQSCAGPSSVENLRIQPKPQTLAFAERCCAMHVNKVSGAPNPASGSNQLGKIETW